MTNIGCITALLITGGSDNLIFSIFSRLQKQGHNITVYSVLPSSKYGSMKRKFEEAGIRVKLPNKIFEPLFLCLGLSLFFPVFVVIPLVNCFRAERITFQYQILYHYINITFVYGGYQVILFLRLLIDHRKCRYEIVSGYHVMVCPILYYIRTLLKISTYYTEISSPKWRSKSVEHIYGKKYFNTFDKIFVPSKIIGEELISYEGLNKTYTVIHFFIDLPSIHFTPPRKVAKTFGVIARLSDEKNQDVLIQVLKQVLTKNSEARLVLIGTGPKEQEFQNLAHSLGVYDQIVFIRHFDGVEDVINYIDIVTLCSDAEGMPLTLIEALYFGKPIIATPIGSIPDMVINDYNGYIINKEEINNIANIILKIMADPNRYCEMAIHSRELYTAQFHSESLFKMLEPYYQSKY